MKTQMKWNVDCQDGRCNVQIYVCMHAQRFYES